MNIIAILSSAILVVGIIAALLFKKNKIDAKIAELNLLKIELKKAEIEADSIVEGAKKEASAIRKDHELRAKEEALKIKEKAEKERKEAKIEIQKNEQRLIKKEENLDRKSEKLEEKEKSLEDAEQVLNLTREDLKDLKERQEKELERIAELTKGEAKELLITNLKGELTHESALAIREFENRLEEDKEKLSKRILSTAMSKAASEYVVDATISVVQLPNDEMKGRIIGREGRNIRAIEALTGVDVIIDDTPEAVVLSSFDGVRREIAKLTVEKLITDGRIHPAKIEETVKKSEKEVNKAIVEAGEQALLELGITGMHHEVVKVLGRLRYRTSYGQNVLTHSIEVGHLASVMAAELGCDVSLAKRAGLLHDIGKALDVDLEGSHALLGMDFLKKFNEKPLVLNAVGAHHNEVEFESVESVLVQAADAISASRPGARRETLSTYLKRLEQLETIANSFEGVDSSFAIQAGRELRIIVNSDQTAEQLGSGLLPVFSTPAMIALMENTAMKCIDDLSEQDSSVGIAINVKHLKASAVGAEISCEAKVVAFEGRNYSFQLVVTDATGSVVGEGTHERVVINIEKFMSKLA